MIESRRVESNIWKYYFNAKGQFVHAVRYITHHYYNNVLSHSSTNFVCGNFGFFNTRSHNQARVYQFPPPNMPLCRRCFPSAPVETRVLELPDDNTQVTSDVLMFEAMK